MKIELNPFKWRSEPKYTLQASLRPATLDSKPVSVVPVVQDVPAKAVESSMTFLKKLGSLALTILTFGAIGLKDAAPIISIFDPTLGALMNATATQIVAAEAAGTSAATSAPATDNGAQKLALVVTAIEPLALEMAQKYGISNPTQTQLEGWVNGFVLAFNALGVDLETTAQGTTTGVKA